MGQESSSFNVAGEQVTPSRRGSLPNDDVLGIFPDHAFFTGTVSPNLLPLLLISLLNQLLYPA